MKRKFECWNCHKEFEADDGQFVVCPHCQSDNVEYKSLHVNPKLWKSVTIIILLGAVAYGLYCIDWTRSDNTVVITDQDDSVEIEKQEIDSTFMAETGLQIPPSIIAGELKFEDDGYNFDVLVNNPPSENFYFAVVDAFEEKVIIKDEKGHFEGVPFSEAPGGCYRVQIRSVRNDSTLATIDLPGFIKQVKVGKKMSVAELQTKINARDNTLMGIGENDYLSPDYQLSFTGLSNDAVNIPTILAEVFDKLDMGTWASVSVRTLEYDELNRISQIKLLVKESETDF